jgi:membrane protein implicated in regulation of membrane protease activity
MMARCEVDNHVFTSWRGRITGFVSVAALILLGLLYGAMMLGLITMALIGFMVKWLWYRRLHRSTVNGWNHVVIEGDYRVLEQSNGQRNGGTQR